MKNKEEHKKEKMEISRKEALMKAGKYAAVTAAAMFFVLSPLKSQTTSTSPGDMPVW